MDLDSIFFIFCRICLYNPIPAISFSKYSLYNFGMKKNANNTYKYETFGYRLDYIMSNRNITNHVLAMQLALSSSAISGYRIGRRSPNVDELARLADALQVSADYLLGLTELET